MALQSSNGSCDSGVITPRQQRSRSTHDRITGAGMALVRAGKFDQAGFRQIVEMAGVSVGAFYGRFRNKEALFHHVQDRFFRETLEWVAAAIGKIEAGCGSLDQAILGAVRTMIDLYGRDLGVMRAIFLRTRVRDDPVLLEKVIAFNLACYGHLERLLLKYKGDISHGDPAAAVRFGGSVLAAFLRDAVFFESGSTRKSLPGEKNAAGAALGPNSIIEKEAVKLLTRYLRGKD